MRNVIPSVTHVDGSARPQTVEKEINPLYWRLIDEFGQRTGVPVVYEYFLQFAWGGDSRYSDACNSDFLQLRAGCFDYRQLSFSKKERCFLSRLSALAIP